MFTHNFDFLTFPDLAFSPRVSLGYAGGQVVGDYEAARLRFAEFLDDFSAPNTSYFVILVIKWVLWLHSLRLGISDQTTCWHLILLAYWGLIKQSLALVGLLLTK